jgi:hypothetical protein
MRYREYGRLRFLTLSRKVTMKELLFCALILLLSIFSVSFAQSVQWAQTYGEQESETAHTVQQTADGGYILAGETWSHTAGWNDFLVVRTDASGDTVWTRKYGGSEREGAYAAHQTADQGFFIAGFTETYGAGYTDFWLLRTDDHGDTLWSRTYGTAAAFERAYCGDLTSDGGYVMAGNKSGTGDYYVVRVDSTGNELWTRSYKPNAGPYVYEAFGIEETYDKGFIIAGNGDSLYVVKTDDTGDVVWDYTYGEGDLGYDVEQTDDGGYIIGGASPVDSYYHMFLMKLDSEGVPLWQKRWRRNLNSRGHAVQQTEEGGYLIAGFTFYQATWVDSVFVVKTDASGDSIWGEVYGGWTDDQAWDIEETADGSYIVTGYTASFGNGDDDFFLMKLSDSQLTPVSVGLIPYDDPIIINPGDSFRFTGILQNHTDTQHSSDAWLMARLPKGFLYGPLRKFDNVPLAPHENITISGAIQKTPAFAPPGNYNYLLYCGEFPSTIDDSTSFEVTVEGLVRNRLPCQKSSP